MKKYDVTIIGAGIGGLVCGCYLAKAGLNVLIVEQHSKPGGYCTSFERKGYKFDVGVHYFGSLREGGILFQILKDLGILGKIKFIVNDPTDRIITPDKTIFIRKDPSNTVKELISNFPKEEKNIKDFFEFMLQKDFLIIVSKTKKITFKTLLDSFFTTPELKSILSILLGNLGLPPSQMSALAAVIFFREFVLDGGYYPSGGIQILPDMLAKKFKDMGGTLLLSRKVNTICTKNNKVIGIILSNQQFIPSDIVVSNADGTMTYCELLDCQVAESKIANRLQTSPSAFVVYLGLKKKLEIHPKHYTTWLFNTYDIEHCYKEQIDLLKLQTLDYILCTFSSLIDPSLALNNKSIVRLFVGAKYADKEKWDASKEKICQLVLKRLEQIIPDIQSCIEIKEIATPCTLNRYTSNREGALFGWASYPTQIDLNIFPSQSNSIKNLYLAGHWVTHGAGQGGVATAGLSGRIGSSLILKEYKINKTI